MIKNGLFGYGRFLLTVVFVSAVALLSGCCSTCLKDVVYQFEIPDGQSNCPSGTTFRNDQAESVDLSGGAGVVDRDGGASIVDRKNNRLIKKYCNDTQCAGNDEPTGAIAVKWQKSRTNKMLIAGQQCESKSDS